MQFFKLKPIFTIFMPSQLHIILQPELLKKHGWKANDAILTEEETVFEELKEYKVGGDQESLGLVRHLSSLYSGRSHCWWGHTELHQGCPVALRRTGDTMICIIPMISIGNPFRPTLSFARTWVVWERTIAAGFFRKRFGLAFSLD